MEETFLRVKTERDELLLRSNQDTIDGDKSPTTMTDEISNLKTEMSRQKKAYEAQFIEYVSLINKILLLGFGLIKVWSIWNELQVFLDNT